jgi:hypothetical protein
MVTISSSESVLTPDDLLTAAAVARSALTPVLDRDWSARAGDLEWTCHRTLAHVANALLFYAAHFATRSTVLRPMAWLDCDDRPVDVILTMVESNAAILAGVVRAAPPGARGYHYGGMADASGFIAMGCEELLIHTNDIARGLRLAFSPPSELAGAVRSRLFPWAPTDADPWAALRWATGRLALPGHQRLGSDWGWHCAPLGEWDGTVAKARWPAW